MPGKASFKFRTHWDGLDRLIVQYRSGLRAVDELTVRMRQRFGAEATRIFQEHAPKKTGRMARSIKARNVGDELTIAIGAKAPSGFPYPRVTRFGHRKALIEPLSDRRVLRLQLAGGRVIYRNKVRGFKPAGDWAEQARGEVRIALRREAVKLGRDVGRAMS